MLESFFDIGLLLVVTAFIIMKLYSILGQDDSARVKDKPNVVSLNPIVVVNQASSEEVVGPLKSQLAPYIRSVFTRINAYDINFSEDSFLKGAKKAFEMIFKAYEARDNATLQMLLSDEVYMELSESLAMDSTHPTGAARTLQTITLAEVIDAKLNGSQAEIKVKFITEQLNGLAEVESIEDRWCFARDVLLADPKWLLLKINC
jgi:predicted lipid-binding transport protein (Tim44 family)